MKKKRQSLKVASGKKFGEELVIEGITFVKIPEFDPLESQEPHMPPIRFKIAKYGDATEGEQNNIPSTSLVEDVAIHSKKRRRRKRGLSINITLEDLEPHFGKTLNLFRKKLGVSRRTIKSVCRENGIKRWPSNPVKSSVRKHFRNNSNKNLPHTNAPLDQHLLDINTKECSQNVAKLIGRDVVIIRATYKGETVKILLNESSKLEKLNQEVARRFNIEIESFRLRYLDEENTWILLACDDDLHLGIGIKLLKALEVHEQQSKHIKDVLTPCSLIVNVEGERDNQHLKNIKDGSIAPKSSKTNQLRKKEVSKENLIKLNDSDESMDFAPSYEQQKIGKYHGRRDYAGRHLLDAHDQQLIDSFADNDLGEHIWSKGVLLVNQSSLMDLLFNNPICGDVISSYLDILCSTVYREQHAISNKMTYLTTYATSNIVSLVKNYTTLPKTKQEYESVINQMNISFRAELRGIHDHIESGIRYIVVPIYDDVHRHWYMLIVDLQRNRIYACNSIWSARSEVVESYVSKFIIGWLECLGHKMQTDVIKPMTQCRQQDLGSMDCGIFVSLWSECFLRDSPEFWAKEACTDIKLYRAQMASTILKDQAMTE